MYFEDAAWFISHVQYMYMAICTPPTDSDREFVLTDHCYNVFEGPAALIRDCNSQEIHTASHVTLHDLAPVTPKLILILRNYVFPLPEEDADPFVAEHRADFRKQAIDDPFGPDAIAKSRLADLPITKARNSYSDVVDGRFRRPTGWQGQFTLSDSFCFKFFSISENHVDAMNELILDNSWLSTTIVFASQASFSRILETYLMTSSNNGKCVTGKNGDARLATLEKLATLSKNLGSQKQPTWMDVVVDDVVDYGELVEHQVAMHRWVKYWTETPLEEQGIFMEPYTKLDIIIARTLFNGDDESLNKRIYQTVLNEASMAVLPRTGLWTEPSPGEDYQFQVAVIHKIMWETPGIPEIEDFAMGVQLDLLEGDIINPDQLNQMEVETQNTIECLTRNASRFLFTELLEGRLDEQTLSDFKRSSLN
ncbi:hypothetical protein PG999_010142 [Apiospora kogelbergensis]|uniref:Uncharacterized protein n=1 Tax=Apiospora kogelbergensis TaxID=1337665 RepID=A0AAW0QQG7_9PEZI